MRSWTSSGPPSCCDGPKTSARSGPKPEPGCWVTCTPSRSPASRGLRLPLGGPGPAGEWVFRRRVRPVRQSVCPRALRRASSSPARAVTGTTSCSGQPTGGQARLANSAPGRSRRARRAGSAAPGSAARPRARTAWCTSASTARAPASSVRSASVVSGRAAEVGAEDVVEADHADVAGHRRRRARPAAASRRSRACRCGATTAVAPEASTASAAAGPPPSVGV